MKITYQQIRGSDVWVYSDAPEIWDPVAQKSTPPTGYMAAFRLDARPNAFFDGEYLKDPSGHARWFPTQDEAVAAAFSEADRHVPK